MILTTITAIGWMSAVYFAFKLSRLGYRMLSRKQTDRSWYERPIFPEKSEGE